MRLGSVATAEDRPCVFVQETDLVLILTSSSKIGTITVVDQRENTAADRNARSARIWAACWRWSGLPVSSNLSVEDCRFIPSLAAQAAVALEAAPHQIRSGKPSEYGSRRSSPGGLGNMGRGFGLAKPLPRSS